jgi:hypothetical protein
LRNWFAHTDKNRPTETIWLEIPNFRTENEIQARYSGIGIDRVFALIPAAWQPAFSSSWLTKTSLSG